MTTYVYARSGTAYHVAPDGLIPVCGFSFRSAFHVARAVPEHRSLCVKCAARLVRETWGEYSSRRTQQTAARAAARDTAITALLVQGFSDAQIARRCGWAFRTRTRHINAAMRRTGARNRFQWGYLHCQSTHGAGRER